MSEWGDKLLTEADNARLRAENEKLRYELELDKFRGAGEIEAYRREASVAVKKAAQAKAENDRLRELVRDLVRWYGAEHQPHEELRFWGDKSSGVYARMRELGIEADE